MLLGFSVRDFLLASWEVPPDTLARRLPTGVEPALAASGAALVSIAGFRCRDVRLAALRGPSFAQLSVRTYVTRGGEPAVFFFSLRVTPPGLAGVLFGLPFRPARIQATGGTVRAPGLGVDLRARPAEAGPVRVPLAGAAPLGSHESGYFLAGGLRRLDAEHDPFAWRAAELLAPPRADVLLALGFDVREPASLLYAAGTAFRVRLPARAVA